ncbi:hypothetical protein BDV10DRAFT_179892 [Aspergillus recurvatus]
MQHSVSQQQQQQQQQQAQAQAQTPVSMIVDSRSAQSGGAVVGTQAGGGNQAGQVVSVESEESDRSESPGGTPGTRDASGADALGEPEFTGEGGQNGRDGGIDVEVLAENGDVTGKGVSVSIGSNGEITHTLPSGLNLTSRKHGKRLTTKEEVFLFEICNRHAADFGRRSNLCKWWMTVTMEFTRGQKHPYSWHSVRRKVELVTKQRMKFLEEQREKGASGTETAEDLSNPRWRAVVDAWIPTWQRWEEAEARRIEKRDSRRPRKRKWTATTPTASITAGDGWDLPSSSAPGSGDAWRAPSSTSSSPMVNHTSTAPSSTPLSSTPVRLPPGFDTLFSQSSQTPPVSTPSNPHAQVHAHRTPQTNHNHNHTHNHNTSHNQPSTPSTTNPPPQQTPDSAVMVAMLETLGKLNKHLESNPTASSFMQTGTNSNSEPTSAQPQPASQDSNSGASEDTQALSPSVLRKLKEDLKSEMMEELRAEWDKERAVLEEKLDSVQRTQEMILDMLRQEPS